MSSIDSPASSLFSIASSAVTPSIMQLHRSTSLLPNRSELEMSKVPSNSESTPPAPRGYSPYFLQIATKSGRAPTSGSLIIIDARMPVPRLDGHVRM